MFEWTCVQNIFFGGTTFSLNYFQGEEFYFSPELVWKMENEKIDESGRLFDNNEQYVYTD